MPATYPAGAQRPACTASATSASSVGAEAAYEPVVVTIMPVEELQHRPGGRRQQREARATFICKRWMTDVGAEKNFVLCGSLDQALSIGERAVFEGGVEHDFIETILKPLKLAVRDTKSPILHMV
jgi:hypothetical protein